MSRRDGARGRADEKEGAEVLHGGGTAGVGTEGSDVAEGAEGELPDEERQAQLAVDEVARRSARGPRATGKRPPGALRRLYRGETSFPFVDRRRWWFLASAVIILAGVVSLGVRGLNLGITFRGGTAWTVPAAGVSQAKAVSAVQAAGLSQPTVQVLGTAGREHIQVQADLNSLNPAQQRAETTRVIDALAHLAHVSANTVSVTHVGPTWGGQVTNRAIIALVVFLVLVAVYISIRFEPKMAVAAFVALLHDLLVTAGIYSLAGFQVTPDTVIAVLTILGYSLYDTVVVFDRVRDNAKGLGSSGRLTYSEMVDLSMNQTLARSVNTSLVAILPVLAVLLIGAELLGATTLQNYGLALVVGLVSGAYSSLFIASPILAVLKEREPRYIAMRQRIDARGERLGRLSPTAAAVLLSGGAGGGAARPGGGGGKSAKGAPARPGTLRPGQARAKVGGPASAGGRAGSAGSSAPAGAAGSTATVTTDGTPAQPPSAGAAAASQRSGAVNGSGGRAGGARNGGSGSRRPPSRPKKGAKGKRRR